MIKAVFKQTVNSKTEVSDNGMEPKEEANWCKAYRIGQGDQADKAHFSNQAGPSGETHRTDWSRILLERLSGLSTASSLVEGIDS